MAIDMHKMVAGDVVHFRNGLGIKITHIEKTYGNYFDLEFDRLDDFPSGIHNLFCSSPPIWNEKGQWCGSYKHAVDLVKIIKEKNNDSN